MPQDKADAAPRREPPPLKALQAFDLFGRLHSVGETAEALGVTSGAVSQQLRKLEAHLGLQLIERAGNQMRLTSWGQMYHEDIAKAFTLIRSAEDKIDQARGYGTITLSTLPSLANKWLGPSLCDWQAKFPDANVRLVSSDVEPDLGNSGVDYRITYSRRIAGHDHFVELFTDSVVPVCAPAFLAHSGVYSAEDLLEQPLLGIEWDMTLPPAPTWSDWAQSMGVTPRAPLRELTFSHSSVAIDAAISGRGVALGQIAMISEDLRTGRLIIPIDHRLRLQDAYYLAWDRSSFSKPFSPKLRDWIMSFSRPKAFKV
ncbi:LysR substrate-binding domain-containing protein [Pararhodobacter oceanensis]|uniref:LysR family transcriptional regulator n=1 Tax=Pararhodobacter oceanensis TaxID=2172121 RepID=A0A2T8HSQ2_9RHOB|nr:LysR substrate-binding domain-containing protein [Pararhodobacter oceanensis]PVH28455.1 LysR family transcriptional regulator [Pararhodobacter oceanensis]